MEEPIKVDEKCCICNEILDRRFARYRLQNNLVMCVLCRLKNEPH